LAVDVMFRPLSPRVFLVLALTICAYVSISVLIAALIS